MIKNLRALRLSKALSQQKLADIIMVSQQSINKYENHNVEPDISTMIKIADFFNVSIDYLVGRTSVERRADALKETDLDLDEQNMVSIFRSLDKNQKELLVKLLKSLI